MSVVVAVVEKGVADVDDAFQVKLTSGVAWPTCQHQVQHRFLSGSHYYSHSHLDSSVHLLDGSAVVVVRHTSLYRRKKIRKTLRGGASKR